VYLALLGLYFVLNYSIGGPTISTIPTRIKFGDGSTTVLNLLQAVENDHYTRLEYCLVGIGQIQPWVNINPLVELSVCISKQPRRYNRK